MKDKKKNILFLLLAGKSERFLFNTKKQFYRDSTNNIPMFIYPLKTAILTNSFEQIFLVIDKEDEALVKNLLKEFNTYLSNYFSSTKINLVFGGQTRHNSVQNALTKTNDYINKNSLDTSNYNIIIHDACRCFAKQQDFINLIKQLETEEAATFISPFSDTIMEINKTNNNISLINRENKIKIYTPQGFTLNLLNKIFAFTNNSATTDEMQIAYKITNKYNTLTGGLHLSKITYKEDIQFYNDYIRGLNIN